MPQIKSQIKTVRKDEEKNKINSARKSEARNQIKKVEKLVDEGKKEEATVALNKAISLIDKLSQDNIISLNSANRKKAHLQHRVASIA